MTTSNMQVRTILLVDDRDDTRIVTKWFLTHFGYAVDSARSAEQALALFDAPTHDLIITDNSMPGMTGAELAHVIKLRSATTPILMYSGRIPVDHACLDAVLLKPAPPLTLKDTVDKLFGIPVAGNV